MIPAVVAVAAGACWWTRTPDVIPSTRLATRRATRLLPFPANIALIVSHPPESRCLTISCPLDNERPAPDSRRDHAPTNRRHMSLRGSAALMATDRARDRAYVIFPLVDSRTSLAHQLARRLARRFAWLCSRTTDHVPLQLRRRVARSCCRRATTRAQAAPADLWSPTDPHTGDQQARVRARARARHTAASSW